MPAAVSNDNGFCSVLCKLEITLIATNDRDTEKGNNYPLISYRFLVTGPLIEHFDLTLGYLQMK